MTRPFTWCALHALAVLTACDSAPTPAPIPTATVSSPAPTASEEVPWKLPTVADFPKLVTPPHNPVTAEKIALGKALFYDKRLGGGMSCEACHKPGRGFADGLKASKKASGRLNERHTPSLYNVGYQRYWGWDGRSPTLEAHIDEEWASQLSVSPDDAAKKVAEAAAYDPLFKAAFGDPAIDRKRIVAALATYVRTIRNGDAPYDRFERGDKTALPEAAQRGWLVFRDKGGCTACHVPPMFTDNQFHNIGIGFKKDAPSDDEGRAAITKRKRDIGAFKTPTLRGAARTAPYFHDGSAATLEGAVDYVLSGGHANPQLDQSLTKLELTPEQKADLVAFIRSLDSPLP